MAISKCEREARKLQVEMSLGMNKFGGHSEMTEIEMNIIKEYIEGNISHDEMDQKLIDNVLKTR